MNEERIRQIVQEEILKSLGDYSKMPLEIEKSITKRLGGVVLATSSKSASSENKTVNESGTDSYGVLQPPDAFAQIEVAGTTIYLPYYT